MVYNTEITKNIYTYASYAPSAKRAQRNTQFIYHTKCNCWFVQPKPHRLNCRWLVIVTTLRCLRIVALTFFTKSQKSYTHKHTHKYAAIVRTTYIYICTCKMGRKHAIYTRSQSFPKICTYFIENMNELIIHHCQRTYNIIKSCMRFCTAHTKSRHVSCSGMEKCARFIDNLSLDWIENFWTLRIMIYS